MRKLLALALVAAISVACSCQTAKKQSDFMRAKPAEPVVAQAEPMQAPQGGVAVIELIGEINSKSADSFTANIEAANEAGAKAIVVELSGPGGSVFAAISMIRAMEKSKAPVICVGTGMIASADTLIYANCSARLSTPLSIYMAHSAALYGLDGLNINDAKDTLSFLEVINEMVLTGTCGKLEPKWKELCIAKVTGGQEFWLSANQAVEAGLSDGMVDTVEAAVMIVQGSLN
jgi:ATP-dependent Clp protease, protease subunit